MGRLTAVLFDLDGTLADTERVHWRAYGTVLLEYGVDVGLDEYRRHWISADGGPEYACHTYRLPMSPAELRARKGVLYRQLIEPGVPAMPGARAALERLGQTRALAVATNTVRDDAALILRHLGLQALLRATIVREDYARSKPAPDAYLAAAAALGVAPAQCAVVEDTERGARAGLAAGMCVIAVPSDLTFDNDFTGVACRLPNLDALTDDVLDTL